MKSNIDELPDLVRLANDIGIQEVKVVYLTVFDNSLEHESLWGYREKVINILNEAEKISEDLGIILKLPHLVGEDNAGNKNHKDCYVTWRDFFLGSDNYVRPCMSTPVKFFKYNKEVDFMNLWNSEEYQNYRKIVNDNEKMDSPCTKCYQSSHCNWNRKESFLQIGEIFSPTWEK
jgi:radical SAM protein with 4Fe4S-binding SPASM domain